MMTFTDLRNYCKTLGYPYTLHDDGEYFVANFKLTNKADMSFYHKELRSLYLLIKRHIKPLDIMAKTNEYAINNSGCLKVQVGCAIVDKDNNILSFGTNKAIPDLCRVEGCLRIIKYGDDSKLHRGPADCRAIHSEVDAISNCARLGIATEGATIYITRYPCEACARQIVQAGIKHVVYGRNQEITDMTKEIFDAYNVTYENDTTITMEDTTR